MTVCKGLDPSIVEPLKVVLAPVEDDPGAPDGIVAAGQDHPVLARLEDFLIRQRIDDRSLLVERLSSRGKTPDCDRRECEPEKRTHVPYDDLPRRIVDSTHRICSPTSRGAFNNVLLDVVPPYVELFDFQIQRRPRNPEFGSGSIWPGNFSVAFHKRGFDDPNPDRTRSQRRTYRIERLYPNPRLRHLRQHRYLYEPCHRLHQRRSLHPLPSQQAQFSANVIGTPNTASTCYRTTIHHTCLSS